MKPLAFGVPVFTHSSCASLHILRAVATNLKVVSQTNVQFHDYSESQKSSNLKNCNLWIKTFKMVSLSHVTLSQHVIKSQSHDQVTVTWLCYSQVTLSWSHASCHTQVITGSHIAHSLDAKQSFQLKKTLWSVNLFIKVYCSEKLWKKKFKFYLCGMTQN